MTFQRGHKINWKGGKVKRNCLFCGKEFKIYNSRIKTGRGKYCSYQCYWKSLEGKSNSRLGIHLTEETKRKMSQKLKGRKVLKITGKNHPNWRDGKSFEPYTIDWTETLRRSIRERDHYLCHLCKQYGNVVHHIDYDKKNCNPSNLINLCKSCNIKVNKNRNYWTNYFND